MDLYQRFIDFIKKEDLFNSGNPLMVAVSGGLDSVVLCALCKKAGYHFSIAHCNFQLRGEESTRDENFVRALAEKYQVPLLLQKFDTGSYAVEHKVSIQVAARELRYKWFHEAGDGACIFTAHHAGDNVETVAMNFFKGTGITGLRGILPKQDKLVRPLLFATREDLLAFAQDNHLEHVEDSSNISDKYTRNYFRNQVLPSVEKVFPALKENIQQSIERFREVEMLYMQSVAFHKKKLIEQRGDEIFIPVLKLKKAAPVKTILYEIIKDYGFSSAQTGEVMNILDSESGRYVASATHRIIKNRNWIIISPVKIEKQELIVIDEKDTIVQYPSGSLKLQVVSVNDHVLSSSPAIAQLDAASVQFPLLLRKWKQGDYFYPLGMRKKKKLSRFFIDQKMSLTDKENAWVIEMNKKIVWIVGRRIDDRFKVQSSAQQVLVIQPV